MPMGYRKGQKTTELINRKAFKPPFFFCYFFSLEATLRKKVVAARKNSIRHNRTELMLLYGYIKALSRAYLLEI